MSEYLKKVVLVGASGTLGTKVLDAFIKQGTHQLTAISRPTSTATFPDGVTVKKGTYDDAAFLESAFTGQDVAIFMLGLPALGDEERLIEAAGKAGVKYIIPSEYGSPSEVPAYTKAIPLIASKLQLHQKIKDLGSKFIVVSTNPWFDYCLERSTFSINLSERKAVLYPDSVAFTTTTTTRVGQGIAKLLALPISTIEQNFSNRFVYLASFHLTQPQIFEAVLKVTRTAENDWDIKRSSTDVLLKESGERFSAGDFGAIGGLITGTVFQHGDFSRKAAEHNEILKLEPEDLNGVILAAVEAAKTTAHEIQWK